MTYTKFQYDSYDQYVKMQMNHCSSQYRTTYRQACRKEDIATLKREFPTAHKVLCIGARDKSEVSDFRSAKFDAIGIDVFSTSDEILVVDMHHIDSVFDVQSYDVAYMSHSLEHSYDPAIVLNKVKRVCKYGCIIILPKMSKPTEKDPIMFDFMNYHMSSIDDVRQAFDVIVDCSIESVYERNPNVIDAGEEIVIVMKF